MQIQLMPQEVTGSYQFDGQTYMTRNFQTTLGDDCLLVVIVAMGLIHERVMTGADYLQVLIYKGTKFWVIDDVSHITFLMPEDY